MSGVRCEGKGDGQELPRLEGLAEGNGSGDRRLQFPQSELYGLVSQIQRAAVSISANIAEGHGREHLGDYLHHLSMANGSLMELETHFLLAGRLGYLKEQQVNRVLDFTAEVGRMLAGLTKSLNNSRSST